MEVNKIAFDTNAYSRLLNGERYLQQILEEASIVYISVIVIGELLFGFKGGNKEKQNKKLLDEFLHNSAVQTINVTAETADIYADVKGTIKTKGKPIPTNDIWIAAHTIEYGAKLVTFDKHFYEIPGLRIWLD